MNEITETHFIRFNAIVAQTSVVQRVIFVMNIRKILSPLLMISYVSGLRVMEYPTGIPRRWLSLPYMTLLWSIYSFIFLYAVVPNTINYSILYFTCYGLNIFTAFLSIVVGIYYDKTFRNCIKNLNFVDDTLEKLGIMNCKVHTRTKRLILGWFMTAILIISVQIQNLKSNIKYTQAVYIPFVRIYYMHINIISDLTIITMLGYVELKFDQLNENLEKLMERDYKNKIKQTSEHSVLVSRQSRYARTPRNGYKIWIVIQLYLELRKISRKIDSIFGTQMTLEMGCYFARIALSSQEVFNIIFIKDYRKDENNTLYIFLLVILLFIEVFRLFFINYECEKVGTKANATGNFISKLSYSSYDVEIRENIIQLLLMTQTPLKFCGLGFFQFGFKFLQGFITSVATVLVILLQAHINANK